MKIMHVLAVTLMLAILPLAAAQSASSRVDTAFQKFWAAKSPEEAVKLADDIVKSGVPFDDAMARLKTGRTYAAQPGGIVRMSNKTNGVDHYFSVNIPENYNPAKKYQVRFQLHGGVGGRADNQPRGNGAIGNLAGAADQIYVLPYAWAEAGWWSDDQVSNLRTIVDQLKRDYNVDENRVVVAGVSDGGTGAYYIAMRETTRFASFLPLNAFIMVLANPDIDDGRSYPNNLRNKPMFAINGGRDRLYPTANVEPYTKHLIANGVKIDYHPQPEGEHNTAWWPQMKGPFEEFVTAHPRDPYPDVLTWTTTAGQHNRAHWLVLDELGTRGGEPAQMADVNDVRSRGAAFQLFEGQKAFGRVDLVRKGNTVEATTKGIASFTLLLSPEEVDFSQPVKVTVNGRSAFDGRVERSLKTLMKWAAEDNDRTMLFGAEVKIKVPNGR